ncbi:MAG: hypothetical protein Q8J64_04570 [Thermodesulfovibrionales bacterium]|nr:hypothetical protein [Thermodesulfovibrionales bacterium]
MRTTVLPINVFSVRDPDDYYYQSVVMNFVDYAVITYPDTPCVPVFKFLASRRHGIISKV